MGAASQDEVRARSSDVLIDVGARSMKCGGAQMNKEPAEDKPDEGRCSLLGPRNESDDHGLYDRPLPCFGCGIGWFCFVLGFAFPLLWYLATVLYLRRYYLRDPREREGLAASAIAALICFVAASIAILAIFL